MIKIISVLSLAQYRELAAFAQFGSELDRSTMMQLERGVRLMEFLKQPQYQPVDVAKQVMVFYAGTNGYIDKYPKEKILSYESELYSFMDAKYPDVLNEISDKKKLDDSLTKKIKSALTEFDKIFKV